eukprot:34138-Rhodomonas_salina.4
MPTRCPVLTLRIAVLVAVSEKGEAFSWGSGTEPYPATPCPVLAHMAPLPATPCPLGHGVGSEEKQLTPKRIAELKGVIVTAVTAALEHTVLVEQGGGAYGCGSNQRGYTSLSPAMLLRARYDKSGTDLGLRATGTCALSYQYCSGSVLRARYGMSGTDLPVYTGRQLGLTIVDAYCVSPRRIQHMNTRHVTTASASALYTAVAARDSPGDEGNLGSRV